MIEEQVQEVLRAQTAGDSRLFGEIAIEYSYINDEVLKKYVEAKKALRAVAEQTVREKESRPDTG